MLGLGTLRFIFSLLVIDAHYQLFRKFLQPILVQRFGVDALPFMGEGYIAVTGFFVISGYVITYVLLHRYPVHHWRGLGVFYLERALRIYPLYWLILGLYLLALAVLTGHIPGKPWFENLSLLPLGIREWFADHNRFGLLDIHGALFIGPAWTLCLDLLFYLIAPFLFLSRSLSWTVWGTGFAYFLAFIALGDPRPPFWFAYIYSTALAHLFAFSCGALLAHYPSLPRLERLGLPLGFMGLFYMGFFPLGMPSAPLAHLLWVLLATGLVAALRHRGSRHIDLLLGDLTYAMYLLHLPLLILLKQQGAPYPPLLGFASTLGLGLMLVYGFERPSHRLRKRFYRRSIHPPHHPLPPPRWLSASIFTLTLAGAGWTLWHNLIAAAAPWHPVPETLSKGWRWQKDDGGLLLEAEGPGEARIRLAERLPERGRLHLDILVTPSQEGQALIQFGNGLAFGLAWTREGCHPYLDGPWVPERWSEDCNLRHRLVIDWAPERAVIALDSLWVRGLPPHRLRSPLSLDVHADGPLSLRIKDIFLGGS